MKKRILALMLCLALVLGLAAPVYAEESEPAGDGVEITVEPETPAPSESVEPSPAPSESVEPSPAPSESVEPTAPVTELCEHGNDPATCEQCQAAAQQQAAQKLYEQFMACETYEEAVALAEEVGEETGMAMLESLSEEQRTSLDDYITVLYEAYLEALAEGEETPAVNYDEVASFRNLPSRTVSPLHRAAAKAKRWTADRGTDGLVLNKKAEANDNGGYTITLEAYTTGTVTTSSSVKPCDIVLVLDRSTSMDKSFSSGSTEYEEVYEGELSRNETYYIKSGSRYISVEWCSTCQRWTNGCWGLLTHHAGTKYTPKTSQEDLSSGHVQFYTQKNVSAMSRMDALKQAATGFVNTVAEKGGDNRIAIVSFGQNAHYETGTSAGNTLLDVSTDQHTIIAAIEGIDADESATEHGKGLADAVAIFAAGTDSSRQRVVILFTDGEPAPYNTNNWSSRVVKQAIENAYTLKNTYSAAVYSVSVAQGTDASNPTTDMDKFMNYVSSNYPDAQYTGTNLDNKNNGGDTYYTGSSNDIIKQITPGTPASTSGSFYLTASDISTLESIFQQISSQTGGSSVDLGSSTQIRDIVTPYFDMPADANVSVKSYDCVSYDEDSGQATWNQAGTALENAVTIDGTTITVTGFDFNRNYLAEIGRMEGDSTQPGEFHGRKLVIEFTVTPREGFWGGDEVPTNGADSGVYTADGSEVELFEVPKVNVPLNVPDFTGNTVNVYYGGAAPADSTLYTPIPLPTGEDDWKDDFVTIGDYTVAGPVSTTEDGGYTVSVTATSGTQSQPKTATATVQVFLPQFAVEAQDVWADYDVNVPLAQWGLIQEARAPKVTVTWKREGVTEPVTMANAEPAISDYVFTFTASGTPDGTLSGGTYTTGTQDADFRVGLTSCRVGSTGYSVPDGAVTVVPAVADEAHDFTVHINKFQMTVTKTATGADTYLQDFIFTVSDGTQSFQIVIHGEGSKTVVGLICGKTYTVTEEEGWSWRYQSGGTERVTCTTDSVSNTAPAEASLTAGTVTMHNTLDNDKWLSGENMKANKFNKTRRRVARKEG